jgi:uncharacterized protein
VIFVDTWAWLAIADRDDQYHQLALAEHRRIQKDRDVLVTSDFVLSETIGLLFRAISFDTASRFIDSVLRNCHEAIRYRLINITPTHFDQAWQMRLSTTTSLASPSLILFRWLSCKRLA